MKRDVPVEKEQDPTFPLETCCFCGDGTSWWTALPDREPGEQVACCRWCAAVQHPDDVPTKTEWCCLEG